MIRILKKDDLYHREREFSDLSFLECTKIRVPDGSWSRKETLLWQYRLFYVRSGTFTFTINKKTRLTLRGGSVLTVAPNALLSARALPGAGELFAVSFSCSDFLFFDLPGGFLCTGVPGSVYPLFCRLRSGVPDGKTPDYATEPLLAFLLDEIGRHTAAEPKKQVLYDRVRRYITDHMDEDLHVADLCREMNYSADYLSGIVRACCGFGISRLIIGEKLAAAKDLLRMTDFSCEKIAKQTGFSSANAFVKFFKYHTGLTPGTYRRQSGG